MAIHGIGIFFRFLVKTKDILASNLLGKFQKGIEQMLLKENWEEGCSEVLRGMVNPWMLLLRSENRTNTHIMQYFLKISCNTW